MLYVFYLELVLPFVLRRLKADLLISAEGFASLSSSCKQIPIMYDLNFEHYGAPYRLCSPQKLYQIFETEKRGRFLFEYVKSSTDKFVSIYDMKDKKLIYKQYTPISYNLKSKDLEKILNP